MTHFLMVSWYLWRLWISNVWTVFEKTICKDGDTGRSCEVWMCLNYFWLFFFLPPFLMPYFLFTNLPKSTSSYHHISLLITKLLSVIVYCLLICPLSLYLFCCLVVIVLLLPMLLHLFTNKKRQTFILTSHTVYDA